MMRRIASRLGLAARSPTPTLSERVHLSRVTNGALGPVAPSFLQRRVTAEADEYRWMRRCELSKQRTRALSALMEAEARHLADVMKGTESFQRELCDEIVAYSSPATAEDGLADATAAERLGDYLYYSGRPPDCESVVYYRQYAPTDSTGNVNEALRGVEEVVLDMNTVTHDLKIECTYVLLGQLKLSADQRFMAFTLDTTGDETFQMYFKDLKTNTLHPHVVDSVVNVVFASDASASSPVLFYTVADSRKRAHKVMRRVVGTAVVDDVCVFEEADPTWFVDVALSKDNSLLTINSNDRVSSEVRVLRADRAFDTPRLIAARQQGTQYFVEHNKGRVFVVTNTDGAVNYKVVVASVDNPSKSTWTDFVSHQHNVRIDDLDMFEHCFVLYTHEGLDARVAVVDVAAAGIDGGAPRSVALPADTVDLFPGANMDFRASSVRFSLASATAPEVDYDCSTATLQMRKVFQQSVGAAPRAAPFNADDFTCYRRWYTSSDGTSVPVTLVHRKDMQRRDGRSPLLLHVYGAYGHPLEVYFKAERLCLLNRGWTLAFAHVRGGGELGREWYTQGKLQRKQNTFDDFVAVARGLAADQFSSPSVMAAKGISAGGLVCGYTALHHPDLFRAMVLKVPFVDVVAAMSDPELPLTTQEYSEWGNPADAHMKQYMMSYSPYDTIPLGVVPPSLLVFSGASDPRVPIWQPLRFMSRLRWRCDDLACADKGVLLGVQVDASGGHFGAAGASARASEDALEFAFLHRALQLEPFRAAGV